MFFSFLGQLCTIQITFEGEMMRNMGIGKEN